MLDSSEFIRSIGGFVNPFGDFEPFPVGEQQIMANSFASDGCNNKAKVTELKYRPGMEGGLVYIPPPKYLALEAGGGQEFLDETSFLRSGGEVMPQPPSPFLIDPMLQQIQDRIESIESQLVQ